MDVSFSIHKLKIAKEEVNTIFKKPTYLLAGKQKVGSSIDQPKSRNQNIDRGTKMVLWVATITATVYVLKFVLKKYVPIGNNLKIGGQLIACIPNHVPKRSPVNPHRLLKPNLPVVGSTFRNGGGINLWARNRTLLVRPAATVYQNTIAQQVYQRQISRVLIARGGALTSSELWELLRSTMKVVTPYAARTLANALILSGYKKSGQAIHILLSFYPVCGFPVDPININRLDQLDKVNIPYKQTDRTPIHFLHNRTHYLLEYTVDQILSKRKHFLFERKPGLKLVASYLHHLIKITTHPNTQFYTDVSFNEHYNMVEQAVVAMYMNATHKYGIIYTVPEDSTCNLSNFTRIIFRTAYNFSEPQFEKLENEGRVQ